MDMTGLLVLILSILVFVGGAVFINFSVKREEAAEQAEKAKVEASAAQSAAPVKKAA